MSLLATRSEVLKLARTLDLEPSKLAFLETVPAEQLRALRAAIYERLHQDARGLAERVGAIAGRLPARASRSLGRRVGPLVTAVGAGEMQSRRATELAAALPTPFLADVCSELDPRRNRDLLRNLPVERFVDVSQELVARGEHMTVSRFVDFVSDDAVKAVEEAIEDEADLLRIAFFIGSKNRVDHLFVMLPRERLERLILRVEQEPAELLPAFLSLLIHVSYALRRELGDLVAAQDPSVLDGYIRAAHEQGLWADVLPAVAAMSAVARTTVVNLPVLTEAPVQEGIIDAADENGLWGIVLPMIELMDDASREAVARILAGHGRTTLERAADAALVGEHWTTLLDLVQRTPPATQQALAEIVRAYGEVDPALAERVTAEAAFIE